MYRVELYARVRRACHVEGMSVREASRVFGLDRKTVRKMLAFSVPPGYRRRERPARPRRPPEASAEEAPNGLFLVGFHPLGLASRHLGEPLADAEPNGEVAQRQDGDEQADRQRAVEQGREPVALVDE